MNQRITQHILLRPVTFYNTFRPHHGRSNFKFSEAIAEDRDNDEEIILKFPTGEPAELKVADFPVVGEIKRHSVTDGLLNHDERVAARALSHKLKITAKLLSSKYSPY